MSFFTLPEELQVACLVFAAQDSLSSLASVALVCRRLHDLVYQDQRLWCQIHMAQYDDPSHACAFLRPRLRYDWKQRVMDRNYVLRFFETERVPAELDPRSMTLMIRAAVRKRAGLGPEPDPVAEAAPRVLRTVLDMYLDMPSARLPSRNAEILDTICNSQLFAFICFKVILGPADERIAHHLQSLLYHMFRWYKPFFQYPSLTCRPLNHHQDEKDVDVSAPQDKTDWRGVACDVGFAARQITHFASTFKGTLASEVASSGLDAVRGSGILGLTEDLDSGDWANVRGKWQINTSSPVPARSLSNSWASTQTPTLQPPVDYDIVPSDKSAVLDACRAYMDGTGEHITWENDFPTIKPLDLAPLPPIYFHGTADDSRVILGIVQLTGDSPPEVRWDVVFIDKWPDRHIFQGVQVGGCQARRGVFGGYTCGDGRPTTEQDYRDEGSTHPPNAGMVWLIKHPE